MAIRKIAQLGEPVLRRVSEEVPPGEIASPRIRSLIADLVETMRDADGAGLAAPQIYEPLRLCVIEVFENPRYPDFPGIPLRVFVNPKITPRFRDSASPHEAEYIRMYEGCLSVAGIRGQVKRPRSVRVEALDENGRRIDEVWEGISAAIIQHETDHLDGVLLVDRADPKTLCFLREYERHVPREARIVDGGGSP